MKKCFVTVTILALVAVLAVGCAGVPSPAAKPTPSPAPAPMLAPASTPAPTLTPVPTPTGERGNFRLLISDEVNAIEDFQHLHVTISSIGVHQAGDSGKWHVFDLDPEADLDGDNVSGVDLRPLEGEKALGIWSGNLTAGEYNKVFIYVDNVTGVLVGGVTANVSLPSDKLQISKPFTITDSVVNFVYDITVVEAGKSGKYILKPQIAQSGPDQKFNVVTAKGKPEKPGKPEGKGKPTGKGKPGKPEDELELRLDGTPGLDATVTLIVTDGGIPVEATVTITTVTISGEEVETKTAVDGSLTIKLPDTPAEVKIEATFEGKSGELELELEEQ